MTFNIRIIRTSSREKTDLLPGRINELRAGGATVVYDEIPPNASWPYTAGSIDDRLACLERALADPTADYIWVARGGYGASDLLPRLDWQKLSKQKPKLLLGFSDVSALHAAFYSKLNWPGLHAPMPATTLWRENGVARDVDATLAMLRDRRFSGAISCRAVTAAKATITGKLFGGCMSVLTNLIGTEFFPKSLAGAIVFLEDTGENPGRLVRMWNQWMQSGALHGVRAVVIGALRDLDAENRWNNALIAEIFAERAPDLPIYVSNDFGHVCPNMPLMLGGQASINLDSLAWRYEAPVASV